jgi:hypothetical protein
MKYGTVEPRKSKLIGGKPVRIPKNSDYPKIYLINHFYSFQHAFAQLLFLLTDKQRRRGVMVSHSAVASAPGVDLEPLLINQECGQYFWTLRELTLV